MQQIVKTNKLLHTDGILPNHGKLKVHIEEENKAQRGRPKNTNARAIHKQGQTET
jgi:hypothetical protein